MISTLELTKAGSQKEGSHYGATKGSDATEGPPADATHSERFRDNLFAFLDGPCMFKVNIANIIIIIVDGCVENYRADVASMAWRLRSTRDHRFLHRSTARSSFAY